MKKYKCAKFIEFILSGEFFLTPNSTELIKKSAVCDNNFKVAWNLFFVNMFKFRRFI